MYQNVVIYDCKVYETVMPLLKRKASTDFNVKPNKLIQKQRNYAK